MKRNCLTLLLLFTGFFLNAQKLDFLGLKGIHFNMSPNEVDNKVVVMDSSSVYKDTSLYIRNNRCLTYFRKDDNLQLIGFTASSIQYEFCDKHLAYVFVNVIGKSEVEKALKQLQLTFKKLGCKGKQLSDCTNIDSSAKGMRLIINMDEKHTKMNFVLIPKAAAK